MRKMKLVSLFQIPSTERFTPLIKYDFIMTFDIMMLSLLQMENSKFPPCLVISSILATCIYISTAAQNFRRDGGVNYTHFVKNPSNRLNVAVLASLMVYRPVDCT